MITYSFHISDFIINNIKLTLRALSPKEERRLTGAKYSSLEEYFPQPPNMTKGFWGFGVLGFWGLGFRF
jgi:hypothetical protein